MLPALLICILGLAGLAAGRFMTAETNGRYLVVGGAGNRAAAIRMVHDAGGGIIGLGRLAPTVLAVSDNPGFAKALRLQGAWLVLPVPGGLGCATSGETR